MPLREEHRLKLDGIVSRMVENGEPKEKIKFLVEDFKQKYSAMSESEPVQPSPEQYKQRTAQMAGSLPTKPENRHPDPIWDNKTGEVVPKNILPYYGQGLKNIKERPAETLFPIASSLNKSGVPIPFTKSIARPGDKKRIPFPTVVKRNLAVPLDVAGWVDRGVDYLSGGAFERGHKTIDEMVPGENIASQTAQGLLKAGLSPSSALTGGVVKKAFAKPTATKIVEQQGKDLLKGQKLLRDVSPVKEIQNIEELTLKEISKGKAGKVIQPTGDLASSTPLGKLPKLLFKKDLSEAEARIMFEPIAEEVIPFTEYAKQSALAKVDTRAISPGQLAGKNATKAFKEVDLMRRNAGKQIDNAIKAKPEAVIDIADIKTAYYDMVEDRIGVKRPQSQKDVLYDLAGNKVETQGVLKELVSDPAAIPIHNDIVETMEMIPDVVDAATAQRLKQNLRSKLKQDPTGQLRLKNSRMDAIQKKVSSMVDAKLDAVLGDNYKKANDMYRKTAKLEDAFSRALGSEFVPGSGLTKHGASIVKRALQSNADSNIGEIFREVKKLTGGKYDLFQDASYANIAMRLSGDANQWRKSMPFGGLIKGAHSKGGGDISRTIETAVDAIGKTGEKVTGGKLARVQKWYSKHHGINEAPGVKPSAIDNVVPAASGLTTKPKVSNQVRVHPDDVIEWINSAKGKQRKTIGDILGNERGSVGNYDELINKKAKDAAGKQISATDIYDFNSPITHESGKSFDGIVRSKQNDMFDGVFGIEGLKGRALGEGGTHHTYIPRIGKVARAGDIDFDYDKSIKFLKKEFPDANDSNIDDLYELIAEDSEITTKITPEDLYNINNNDEVHYLGKFLPTDLGEASWEAQNLRGKMAISQGYDAVTMADENGASVLIPHGSKAMYVGKNVDNRKKTIGESLGNTGEFSKLTDDILGNERGAIGTNPQTKTKKFKDWFGDYEKSPEKASKVVDESGKPLVVYHGGRKTFDAFDPKMAGKSGTPKTGKSKVMYFTDFPRNAYNYARQGWDYKTYKESGNINHAIMSGQNIKATYLKIDNPLYYDVKGRVTTNRETVKKLLKKAKEEGNDGIVLKNTRDFSEEQDPVTHYIAFNPNQIKSATGNTGEFSKLTDDIRGSSALKTLAATGAASGAGLTIGEVLSRKFNKKKKKK